MFKSIFRCSRKHILQNERDAASHMPCFCPRSKHLVWLSALGGQLAAGGYASFIHCAVLSPSHNREPEERHCHRPGSNVVPSNKPRPRRPLEQSSSSLPRPAQSARRRNPPPRILLPLVPSLSQSIASGSIEEVIRGTRL